MNLCESENEGPYSFLLINPLHQQEGTKATRSLVTAVVTYLGLEK